MNALDFCREKQPLDVVKVTITIFLFYTKKSSSKSNLEPPAKKSYLTIGKLGSIIFKVFITVIMF